MYHTFSNLILGSIGDEGDVGNIKKYHFRIEYLYYKMFNITMKHTYTHIQQTCKINNVKYTKRQTTRNVQGHKEKQFRSPSSKTAKNLRIFGNFGAVL